MRLTTKTATFVLALAATAVLAAEATDPAAKARQELMDTIGMNAKILGDMAGDKTAFDAAAAEAAKAAIVAASTEIPAKFETQSSDPKSAAKAEVWANFEDFKKDAGALNSAATALDVASLDALKASVGPVFGACKDCHTEYKSK